MKNVRPGFAIVRVDRFQSDDEERVTVKRVVWDQALAENEVRRLNEVNADKDCVYFWKFTRVDTDVRAHEAREPLPLPPPFTRIVGRPEIAGVQRRRRWTWRVIPHGRAPAPPPPTPGVGSPETRGGAGREQK